MAELYEMSVVFGQSVGERGARVIGDKGGRSEGCERGGVCLDSVVAGSAGMQGWV